MKKYFLIVLFHIFILLPLAAEAQVTIPDETARYFLEQDLRAKKLEEIVKVKDSRVQNLEIQNRLNAQIKATFISDGKVYRDLIKVKDDQLKTKNKEIEILRKEVKRENRQKNMVIGAGVGAGIGSLAGPEGAVIGGLIGGGVGFVVSLFKKK